jgi:protein TonB
MKKYTLAMALLCAVATAAQAQQKKEERTLQPVKVSLEGDDGLTVEPPPPPPPQEPGKPEPRFTSVEQMPEFPGGAAAMQAFIEANLDYPQAAKAKDIQGRVIVRFAVERDGRITEVEAVRKLDPECDKEAVRMVKTMPKWKPGKQNGQAVPVYMNLPVSFKLDKY